MFELIKNGNFNSILFLISSFIDMNFDFIISDNRQQLLAFNTFLKENLRNKELNFYKINIAEMKKYLIL
jgi:hypothetical protein